MPPLKAIIRFILVWVAWMSGVLAIIWQVYSTYLATQGNPVSPSVTFQVIGNMAIIAFVVAGFIAWNFEHQRVKELEAGNQNPVRALTKLRDLLHSGREILGRFEKMSVPLPKPKHMIGWESSVQSIIESQSLERIMSADVTTPWINTAPTNTDVFVTDYFHRFAKYPPPELIRAYGRMVDRVTRLGNLLRQIRS